MTSNYTPRKACCYQHKAEKKSNDDVEKAQLAQVAGDANADGLRTIVLEDVIDTLRLAIPIFIARVSYVGMKTTDTALLGHVSGEALSAAALSDLWTMCTAVLIQGRVLTILVRQSIGAGNNYLAIVYFRISCCKFDGVIDLSITWIITSSPRQH